MVKAKPWLSVGALALSALSFANCDRGAGDLPPWQSADAGSDGVAGDAGLQGPGLNPVPHVIEPPQPQYLYDEPDAGVAGEQDFASCGEQEVMVGMEVVLKTGHPSKPPYIVFDYAYPIAVTPRCAHLNLDGSLGDSHSIETLRATDEVGAKPPVMLNCPAGAGVVSIRGSLNQETSSGRLWVESVGIECASLKAWFHSGAWDTEQRQAGSFGSLPFVLPCLNAFAVITGIAARSDALFRQMSAQCSVVHGSNFPSPT